MDGLSYQNLMGEDVRKIQLNLDLTRLENWFIISSFVSIHFKSPGWRMSFIIPRTSLYRGSLNRHSIVLEKLLFSFFFIGKKKPS